MTYHKSIIETIKKRTSIRTYDNQPLLEKDYDQINEYISKPSHLIGPFGREMKIDLVPVHKNVTDKGLKIGTYGFIKNPQAYLVGIMEKDDTATVEFGYVFEKLILFLTELEIGTCWLGGTFTRSSFERELNFNEHEMIPAITPIGYSKGKKRLFEKTLRSLVKADNKKPWSDLFFNQNFQTPLEQIDSGQFDVPLEMVRLGPSASNKQPWRIILSEDKRMCHFFLEKTPNYSGNKLGFIMQRLDLGIAMCHFELTCKELNIEGTWSVDDPSIDPISEYTEYIVSWKS